MRVFTLIAGIACLFAVLLDAFQTIILPRRATGRFRLTRIFYGLTWRPWAFAACLMPNPRKRETLFSFYGPLSLIVLLVLWAGGMVFGFALDLLFAGKPVQRWSAKARACDPTSTSAGPRSSPWGSAT